jgi:hypothetical protein
MAENDTKQITERELREAELQMTGRLPVAATAFIGFVPAAPATSSEGGTSDGGAASGGNNPTETGKQ